MVHNMPMLQNILTSYAQTIVDNVQAFINYDILITDKRGIVIAASDRQRLGSLHSHSLTVIEKRLSESMCEAEALAHGIKQGVCIPIQIEGEVIGTAGITGDPDVVGKLGRFVQKEVELFVREKSLQDYSYLRERAISSLTDQILAFDQKNTNEATVYSRADELGYDLHGKKTAIIVDIIEFEKIVGNIRSEQMHNGSAELNVQILKNSILRLLRDNANGAKNIVTNITSDKFLILMDTEGLSEARLHDEISLIAEKTTANIRDMRASAVFGIGYAAEDITEIQDSVDSAWNALKIGKLAYPGQSIYYIEDFALEDMLFSLKWTQVRHYLQKTLTRLYESPEWTEDLEKTLHEWLMTPFMQGEVAGRLSIHRNSLYYRLDRIKQLGGADLHNNNDVFALKIAFILKSFFAEEFVELLNKSPYKK